VQRVTSDYSIRLEYKGQNEGQRFIPPTRSSTGFDCAESGELPAQHLGPGNVSNERIGNPANLI